jgi:peptidoglycan DL-endopeptidase CwlO
MGVQEVPKIAPDGGALPTARNERRRARLARPAMLLLLGAALAVLAAPTAAATPGSHNGPTTTSSLVLKGQVKRDHEDLQAQAKAVEDEIERLDHEIATLNEDYGELQERLIELNAELVKLRRELGNAEDNFQYREELINRRLTAVYKAGDNALLNVILLSRNLNDFMKRVVLVHQITKRDHLMATDFHESADEKSVLESEIAAKKQEALALERAIEQKKLQIEARLVERAATLQAVQADIKQLLEEERLRQEEERRRLEAELRARLEAQAAAARAAAARAAAVSARGASLAIPVNAGGDSVLMQVVETAANYLGIPYKWGGKRPSTGLDCSGLTKWVFEQHGVTIRYWSRHQAQEGEPVALSDIRPGDLVAFGFPVYHVGIYVGEDRFIHAPRTGDVVKVSVLSARKDLSAIRRFPFQPRLAPPVWG